MVDNKQLCDIDEAILIVKNTLTRMESMYQEIERNYDRLIREYTGVKTKRGDYITIDEVRIQLLNDIAETSKKLVQMSDIRLNNEKKVEELAFIREVLNKMNNKAALEIAGEKVDIEDIEQMIEKDKADNEETVN